MIGTRPYEIGDPVSTIDWFASARLSAATGRDEFIVRDHAADEAPRVVVVCDRRPAMGIYDESLPWLSKPHAIAEVTAAARRRARSPRARTSRRSTSATGTPYWLPPGRRDVPWLVQERQSSAASTRPRTTSSQALAFLGRLHSDLRTGTFVFVVSDFLAPPPPDTWLDAVARGWDVVPVIVRTRSGSRAFRTSRGVAVPIA